MDLATRTKVSTPTITRFENDRSKPNASTLTVLRLAFESAGIEFLNDGAVRPPPSDNPKAG